MANLVAEQREAYGAAQGLALDWLFPATTTTDSSWTTLNYVHVQYEYDVYDRIPESHDLGEKTRRDRLCLDCIFPSHSAVRLYACEPLDRNTQADGSWRNGTCELCSHGRDGDASVYSAC
jgi:hypothetical protein